MIGATIVNTATAELEDPWGKVLRRVRSDLRGAGDTLSVDEVRYLVDMYYSIQDFRIQATGQARALSADAEPHSATAFIAEGTRWIEESIKAVLDRYTATEPTGMGAWARDIVGIGPVLSAGLLAHRAFDPRFATVGHTWSFAGLIHGVVWEKGQKRPWNARFKALCWKIGESFVKFSNHKDDIYGHIYHERKLLEQARNERGELADQAAEKLARFRIGKDTEAYGYYAAGKLPPAHIHARARRYAVKLFLAHYFEEAYTRHFKHEPPLPYPIAHLGHAHLIERPNPTRLAAED